MWEVTASAYITMAVGYSLKFVMAFASGANVIKPFSSSFTSVCNKLEYLSLGLSSLV
jgi:hypothetical protein